jgi:signal transduction histidine kinase
MDRPEVTQPREKWYGRLQVQLWLWFVLPVLLVLVALTLSSAYNNQEVIRDLSTERDVDVAQLYARQISDALTHGTVAPDSVGLDRLIGDGTVGQHGAVYVIDNAGRVLFRPDTDDQDVQLRLDTALLQALDSDTGTVQGTLSDGSLTLVSFAAVGQTHWRVLVEEPAPEVILPLLRASNTLPLLLVAAGLLSLLFIDFSLHTVVRPLRSLAEAATQQAWGDLPDLRQDVGGVEEIRHLQRVLRDMVERVRRYQESMRNYVDAVTQGQEAERTRISHELHDETVQDLIATAQRLQLTQRALERGDAQQALETLRETRELTQRMLDELRRLIGALRPIYLDDLGFLPALEMLVQESRSAELSTEVIIEGEPRRLRPAIELAAFRVAQEALANTTQHADAHHATLRVAFSEHELILSVEDDGTGFAVPSVPDAFTQFGHFGLVGMRERVALAGGSLDVQSQPGRGTCITAHFPA